MLNQFLVSAIIKKARRQRAKDDIQFFAEYYLPHVLTDKSPEFHKEILNLAQNERRLGVAAPRGFAKTTIIQIVYGLYCLLFDDGEDILSISQSAQLAEDQVRKIKYEFEGNQRIKNDFGGILQWGEKDSKRWTNSHLVIQKEGRVFSQVRARGRGCQVRGLRPTKVFCDDSEDEELVRSDEQRKYLKEWFLSALLNVLKIDQQLIVIGTILHPLALLGDIIDKKEQFKGWVTRKYKAIVDGKSIWENRFPMVDLLKRKEEIGTYAFESEYQNNPISSDICLWRPDWIKKWDKLPTIKKKFIALDPATSTKESADCSGLTCIGEGEDGKIYEIESIKGRWGTWDLVDRCIKFYQKHQPLRFGIEEVAFQSVMKDLLIREARKQSIYLPIEALRLGAYTETQKQIKQPHDKYTRALSIIHFFEQDLVRLKTQDLIDQLVVFPTGGEDDLVDSLVYSLMMLRKYTPVKVMVNNPQRQPIRSFEVKDNTIPCFAPPIEQQKQQRSWKIG